MIDASNSKHPARLSWQIVAAVLSGQLLCVPFLDHAYFALVWFAFAPILVALRQASLLRSYALGLLMGTVAYANGMYWIVDFIMISKGYGVGKSIVISCLYWIYCAHLIALLIVSYRWILSYTKLPALLVFPTLLASFSAWYPMLFAMRLGDSQVEFSLALQAIEYTGVHGIDIIIGIVTILIVHCINWFLMRVALCSPSPKTPSIVTLLSSLTLVITWFGASIYLNQYWTQRAATSPKIKLGLVQSNEIPSLGANMSYPGYGLSYPPEMHMTEELVQQGAELVIWPEGRSKHFLNTPQVRAAYQKQIAELEVSLMFHDMRHHRNSQNAELERQTSKAILINDDGSLGAQYTKIKRIPFGEYVPMTNGNSFLNRWIKSIFGEFLVETSIGENHEVFELDSINIIPLICYETTEPSLVGRAVRHAHNTIEQSTSSKKLDTKPSVIVALSNDGWFGSSHQPFQHILPSALRAIENRLPLVHVANNGPSIAVLPNGKIHFKADFQKAGGYLVDMPIDAQTSPTFFARYPMLFEIIVLAMSLLLLCFTVFEHLRPSKR